MRTPLLAVSFTREAALMMRGSCSCLQAAEQPEKLADEHSTSHTGFAASWLLFGVARALRIDLDML
jgi:hypothetical protein